MQLSVPTSITSPGEATLCLRELVRIQDSLRSANLAKRTGVERPSAGVAMSTATQELLQTAARPDQPSLSELGMAIEFMERIKDETPVITLTVATELQPSGRKQIAKWFQDLRGEPVFCKYVVNPRIAGGVIVRTPNRIYDYSYIGHLQESIPELQKELSRG